jgi:hypothetical protein
VKHPLLVSVSILCIAHVAHAGEVKKLGLSGLVEGLALSDVDGDGRSEVFTLLRRGTVADPSQSSGSVAMFGADGKLRWERIGSQNLSGGITSGDFDGDGMSEVAYCESAEKGRCFVVDGDGKSLWQTPELYFPGISGSAPAAGDLTHDGVVDLVAVSWGGTVAAFDGPTGFEIWRYEAFPALGELFHCNPTLVDLNGDSTDDVVLLGAEKGMVVALDGVDGQLLWATESLRASFGNFSRGNGVLITELRPGEGSELVVSLRGTPTQSTLLGLTRTGKQLFRTEIAGSLAYMSAVAGDIDGDGKRELFVQSRNGQLNQFDTSGKVVQSVEVGKESWLSPSFVDINGDGIVEILASSTTGVKILSGQKLTVLSELSELAQGLQPSPVVADIERDGKVEFFMGSWFGTDLLRVQFDVPSWHRWDTLAGEGKHQGQHALGAAQGSGVVRISALQTALEGQLKNVSGKDKTRLESAIAALAAATTKLSLGDLKAAILELRKAEKDLAQAGANFGDEQAMLGEVTFEITLQAVNRMTAIVSGENSKIERAKGLLEDAQDLLEDNSVAAALIAMEQALAAISGRLGVTGNYCAEVSLEEPYLPLQCEMLKTAYQIADTSGLARETILLGLSAFPFLNVVATLTAVGGGVALLPSDSEAAGELVETARKVARLYVDERAIAGRGKLDLSKAESSYEAGLKAMADDDFTLAVAKFAASAAWASGNK